MENQNEHINPWAEKLNELHVPGAGDSWPAMGSLLDAELPVQPKKDRRRWALLLLLLLLLIGVCHFPHTTQTAVKVVPGKNKAAAATADSAGFADEGIGLRSAGENKAVGQASRGKGGGSGPYADQNQVAEKDKTAEPEKITLPGKSIAVQNKKRAAAAETAINQHKKTGQSESLSPHPETARESKENFGSPEAAYAGQAEIPGNKKAGRTTHTKGGQRQPEVLSTGAQPQTIRPIAPDSSGLDTVSQKAETPQAGGDKKNPRKPSPEPLRSGEKRARPAAKKDSVEDAKGWAFGLGLNQFFIVGDQEKSNFNSNGSSGTISDYIPVPAARYYFHQWFYLQAEAQINSPQYTKTLLAGQGIKTASFSGEPAVQSVFIKKLFYFNIPVSIHYSPLKNLFVGAGLQYSRLTNGVALFQDTRLSGGFGPNVVRAGDSLLLVSKVGNFKKDSAYRQLRTNEWRFLLDLNYQWKRLTIGVRYNQAFSNFINIHLSYLNITQAQNRSLQLYLRYMVLDRRRKFLIPAN